MLSHECSHCCIFEFRGQRSLHFQMNLGRILRGGKEKIRTRSMFIVGISFSPSEYGTIVPGPRISWFSAQQTTASAASRHIKTPLGIPFLVVFLLCFLHRVPNRDLQHYGEQFMSWRLMVILYSCRQVKFSLSAISKDMCLRAEVWGQEISEAFLVHDIKWKHVFQLCLLSKCLKLLSTTAESQRHTLMTVMRRIVQKKTPKFCFRI